ncbi:hypothetical protein PFFCH_04859 [Plasmodium falciparum FCH/4]|uniref:Uncharacterized protein n=1 Tax=Plasmodium falciparum FCH/4 TaxID=1036724 RepID=A0A024VG76_PLAFA|nr:hypothetical protein PFFCH_04859 [Plasmodium falciparum FCH/4]
MDFIKEQYNSLVLDLRKTFRNKRDGLSHILNVICLLLNALMIWKLLVVFTGLKKKKKKNLDPQISSLIHYDQI